MTVLKVQQADRALVQKLGFEKTESHHHIYRLWLDGMLAARTYISHGERQLSPYHISQMSRQMRLTKEQFVDAIMCPLGQEEYYHILREEAGEI